MDKNLLKLPTFSSLKRHVIWPFSAAALHLFFKCEWENGTSKMDLGGVLLCVDVGRGRECG